MASASGSGPGGPGPDARLEAIRRRLYAPGAATDELVAEYARLRDRNRSEPEVPMPAPAADAEAGADAERPTAALAARTRRRRRSVVLVGVVAVAVAGVVVGLLQARSERPHHLALPSLPGDTLFAWGRDADPAIRAGEVTYQPQGYTVFQPGGRVVAVALRCVGPGSVRISAGTPFDFRCGDRVEQFRVRRAQGSELPFVLMARTSGDVVWSARVTLLDSGSATAGAIPAFRVGCDRCRVVDG